jgi:hypothetical protein
VTRKDHQASYRDARFMLALPVERLYIASIL